MHTRSDGLNSHKKAEPCNRCARLDQAVGTPGVTPTRIIPTHVNPTSSVPSLLIPNHNSKPPSSWMRGSLEQSPDSPCPIHTWPSPHCSPWVPQSCPCTREGDGHGATSSLPPFPGSLIRAFLGKTILFQTQKFYF